ncbi:hypothetical protein LINGRAHAP2_LOCUS7513 [Linum grandiflorum]
MFGGVEKSSSSTGSNRPVCKHKESTLVNVSQTGKNPCRRFYRCPFWKDKTMDCGYFKWTDEADGNGDIAVTGEHHKSIKELKRELTDCERRLVVAEEKSARRKAKLSTIRCEPSADCCSHSTIVSELKELNSNIRRVLFSFVFLYVVIIVLQT